MAAAMSSVAFLATPSKVLALRSFHRVHPMSRTSESNPRRAGLGTCFLALVHHSQKEGAGM